MQMKCVLGVALAAGFGLLAPPARAATFTFDVEVIESIDTVRPPEFDLPDVGSVGTVSFFLDAATLDADSDPLTGVNVEFDPLPQALADAKVTIGDFSADLTGVNIFSFPIGARFSNGSFANIDISLPGVDCPALGCTFAGSFAIINPLAPEPTVFADVEALLLDPASVARFSFNGTLQGDFVSFLAVSTPVPVVPLPAGGWLLLSAVGGFAVLRRRQNANIKNA